MFVVVVVVLLLAGPSPAAVRDVSISVGESLSAGTAAPGDTFTVSLSATNHGSDPQAPFSLVLNLGVGDWSVGGANDGCARPNQWDIDCERSSLAPGETFSTSVTVTIGPTASPGDIYDVRVSAFPGGTSGGALAGDSRSIQIVEAPEAPPPPPTTTTPAPAPAPAPTSSALSIALQGSGVGFVTSAPVGLSCGTQCTASFGHGTAVTLTATPAAGSVFAGWGGACAASATNAQCTVILNADNGVSATFDLAPATTVTPTTPSAPPSPACIVPKVVGLSLGPAGKRLTHAHCRLGAVTKRKGRRAQVGLVVAQHPWVGQYLDNGSKVAVVVGR